MAITPSTYSAGAIPNFVSNVAIKFLDKLENQPSDMVRDLFTKVDWNPIYGEKVTFDSFALPQYAQRVAENESYPIISVQEGDQLTKTQQQYSAKMLYTVRMEQFDKTGLAEQFAGTMLDSLYRTLDLELTHQIFTYADSATYTPRLSSAGAVSIATADTQALASASHTVQGTGATTYSNILSGGGALSVANITALLQQAVGTTVNDKGDLVPVSPDMLIIADDPYMKKKAIEILGSPLTPEVSTNAVNVYAPGSILNMRLVVLKKGAYNTLGAYDSTKRYRWALMDSGYKSSFQMAVSSSPLIRVKQSSADNAHVDILADMFAAYGCPRWQGIWFSLSTTQPS